MIIKLSRMFSSSKPNNMRVTVRPIRHLAHSLRWKILTKTLHLFERSISAIRILWKKKWLTVFLPLNSFLDFIPSSNSCIGDLPVINLSIHVRNVNSKRKSSEKRNRYMNISARKNIFGGRRSTTGGLLSGVAAWGFRGANPHPQEAGEVFKKFVKN